VTPLNYHEAAEEELLREIGYLELRTKGLGKRFFGEIRRAEKIISKYPESGEEIRPGIRKQVLRKFRYSIIYSTATEGVLVLAIAHHSRRPSYWLGRISSEE